MDFTGKNIVVTGASSGIGRAAANLLAQRGPMMLRLKRLLNIFSLCPRIFMG